MAHLASNLASKSKSALKPLAQLMSTSRAPVAVQHDSENLQVQNDFQNPPKGDLICIYVYIYRYFYVCTKYAYILRTLFGGPGAASSES